MSVLTCLNLMIVVVVHEKTITAQVLPTNLFGTKNSYNASLELWKDEPVVIENENIKACCEPIQVTSKARSTPATSCRSNVVEATGNFVACCFYNVADVDGF